MENSERDGNTRPPDQPLEKPICRSFSHVQLFVTLWTLAHQTALSIIQYYPARILEWVAISSSRGSSRPTHQTHISCGFCIGRQILFHWAGLGSPNITLNGGQTQNTKLSWTFISQNRSFPISVLHSIRCLNHRYHFPSISHFNTFPATCDTKAMALKTHKPKLR